MSFGDSFSGIGLAAGCVLALSCASGGSRVTTSPPGLAGAESNPLATTLITWPVHSRERPQPPIVTPAGFVSSPPPSDAIVLFNGTGLSGWRTSGKQEPAQWNLANGYMEVVPGTGDIETTAAFGDIQLHVEWATPVPTGGTDQERGNSGVYIMKTYEVQVLDSYGNVTYPDGQAGAIFGQYPPLVNASRPPEEWQSYDIVFHRPRFARDSSLITPARITVLQNGILVQDNVTVTGPTSGGRHPYRYLPERMPLRLQDHEFKVRYRNIWIRDLERAINNE